MFDSLASLYHQLSGPEIAFVAGAMLVAGFIRGFVGFGASLIIVMVLSMVLGPLAAVPIASLSGLPAMVQLLPTAIRSSERSFVVPFGIATFAAAPLGTLVLVSVDASLMKIAISVFVLAMVAMLHLDWRPTRAPGPAAFVAVGVASGLVQGSAGVGGPPAVAVALSRPGTPQQQRANVIGAVAALSICALGPIWYHGLITRQVIVASLILFPLYVGSTWIGARFFTRRGHRHFRNGALVILASIGFATLAVAIRDYLTV